MSTHLVSLALQQMEGRALRNCDRIVVLSDFSRRLLQTIHRGVNASVVAISGGVDVEHFHPAPDRSGLRDKLNLPKDVLLLLTVRDLEQRMGIDILLRALRRLPSDRPYQCLIGGTGPLRAFLEELAHRLGIAERVRFLGHIPEEQLPLYYQAADLFVLPTRSHEGFGLVTVEALACGTPVVATPAGATPEILGPLDRRLLASDPGELALASSLMEALPLAGDEEFRRRCRIYAKTNYSWNRHTEALENVLLAAAGEKRPADALPYQMNS
jgi:glycosyltransferase involved in cell wall biosynthesis